MVGLDRCCIKSRRCLRIVYTTKTAGIGGVEFDTETSRIKILISNFKKRLQLPGFSPVRDIYLIAVVMLMFSSIN